MPITKKDKVSNVANSGFTPTFRYGPEQYEKDRFGTDSSAFVLGMRRFFEITKPQTLVEQRFSELRFSIAFKLDTLTIPQGETLGNWSTLLLGDELWSNKINLGIYYDYQDSSVGTFDKTLSFKTGAWQKWHTVELVYGQQLALWVDGKKVDSASTVKPDYGFAQPLLGCGTHVSDYFYGLVDEILVTGVPLQVLAIEDQRKEEKQLVKVSGYNLQGQLLFESIDSTWSAPQQGVILLRKEFSDGTSSTRKVLVK